MYGPTHRPGGYAALSIGPIAYWFSGFLSQDFVPGIPTVIIGVDPVSPLGAVIGRDIGRHVGLLRHCGSGTAENAREDKYAKNEKRDQ